MNSPVLMETATASTNPISHLRQCERMSLLAVYEAGSEDYLNAG